MNVVVLCPTRERPGKAAEMVASLRDTSVLLATEVLLVVDRDDPLLGEYLALPGRFNHQSPGPLWPPDPVRVVVLDPHETGSLTAATNCVATRVWGDDCIIGHVGDDHRFETVGWDQRFIEALKTPGVAYGDDGHWHERIPTAAFISSVIPRTLGWYALPASRHYGIDNAWADLGRGIGALHYLPDVMIRQPRYPAEVDDVYRRAQTTRAADREGYFRWRDGGGLKADVAKLRAALGEMAA